MSWVLINARYVIVGLTGFETNKNNQTVHVAIAMHPQKFLIGTLEQCHQLARFHRVECIRIGYVLRSTTLSSRG